MPLAFVAIRPETRGTCRKMQRIHQESEKQCGFIDLVEYLHVTEYEDSSSVIIVATLAVL